MKAERERAFFEFPGDSWKALKELADITGAGDFAKLLQDAIRTEEWIINLQSQGYTIVALSESQKNFLKNGHPDDVTDSLTLETFIKPGKEKQAVAYFKQGEKE